MSNVLNNALRYFIPILLSLFVVFESANGQAVKNAFNEGRLAVEMGVKYGKIFKHTPLFKPEVNELTGLYELTASVNTGGGRLWHQLHGYPIFGLSFIHARYGDAHVFGKGYALVPSLTFLTRTRHINLHYKLGLGIAYLNKPYHRISNPENNVIGSHLNNATMFVLGLEWKILPQLRLMGTLSFTHFSNGKVQSPICHTVPRPHILIPFHLEWRNVHRVIIQLSTEFVDMFAGMQWPWYCVQTNQPTLAAILPVLPLLRHYMAWVINHFWHAPTEEHGGDLIYSQGHSSPGIYAYAYLAGELKQEQLDNFRQEADGKGLSSYPHPWLMPDFWQFPTVSMGLGPLMAIYQARFMKYLDSRGLAKTNGRKTWAFMGDGEMDEPESMGAITLASREKLDNLIFVVNCNLQRLDGPVRGNGKIIQELEGAFRGAGWNVIKVIWGSYWDQLLAKDKHGLLQKRMMECVDGEYQTFKARDGAYVRKHFFGKYPELLEMVAGMSDDDIWRLNRGGHDPYKVVCGVCSSS